MRKISITCYDSGFGVGDDDEQYVDVEYRGDIAYFLSCLHGDDEPVFGSFKYDGDEDKCLFAALALLGVVSVEHLI